MITVAGVSYAMQAPFRETIERIGEQDRAFDGGLYSQVRVEKRRWSGSTSFLTNAQLATLKSNTALDAVVTVVDTIRSITISAMVRVEPELGIGALWTAALDIREV
jgi:hypothetical protein